MPCARLNESPFAPFCVSNAEDARAATDWQLYPGIEPPPCASAEECTSRQVAVWARAQRSAARIAQAAFASPTHSLSDLRRRRACTHLGPASLHADSTTPVWNRPKLLRVPKAASSYFLETAQFGCNESRRDPIAMHEHQAPPSISCRSVTIATLREPCERWVSIFRQFESTYAQGNALCTYYRALCDQHWVRRAKNASHFFELTRERWVSVLGAPSITLEDNHPASK